MADFAAVFDADTDRALRTTDILSNRAAHTITCWVKITSFAAAGVIFSLNHSSLYDSSTNYGFTTGGNLFATVDFFGTGATGSTVLSLNTWYWLAFVRTAMAGDTRCYLDSVQECSYTASTEFADTSNRMEVGGVLTDNLAAARIHVAYMRAWSVALTTVEMAAEKNSVSAVKTANLYADWPLQNDANDISANARHWSATGLTYTDGPGIAVATGGFMGLNRGFWGA